MVYSALYIKKSKKIFYLLGMAAFLSLVLFGFFFITQLGRKNGWQKTAGIDKLYVVNRSSHGFEIVWSTKNSVKEDQWVEVGTKKGIYPIISKLERNGEVYRAIISGLNANTTYYFRVRVGTKTYILPSLISETISTPKEVKEKPISPAYGKVLLSSTKPYANGLLIYEVDGYYPLAVLTKETGEWLLPLTGLIEKTSNSITPVADSTPLFIKLFAYPDGIIRTIVSQTRPMRKAIIAGTSLQYAKSTQNEEESVLGISSQDFSSQTKNISNITYPKENALIPGNTPLIRGTAQMGSDITVLIQAPGRQYSYRTKADEKGDWLIQYPLVLGPGKYTIVATIENNKETPIILRRIFNIIKSGEQVLGVASGSPTLIPTYGSLVPTIAPTGGLSPTQAPTTIQYPTVVAPTRFTPSTTPPVTGGGDYIFIFGALFFIVIGTGLVLAF